MEMRRSTRHRLSAAGPFAAIIATTAVALLGCDTGLEPTPPGPLGMLDVRDRLPDGVTAPDELREHTVTRAVCEDEGFESAEVKLTWRTFSVGEDTYVAEVAAALVKSGEHQIVTLEDAPTVGGVGLEVNAPWLGVVQVVLRCHRKGRQGVRSYDFQDLAILPLQADGELQAAPAGAQ